MQDAARDHTGNGKGPPAPAGGRCQQGQLWQCAGGGWQYGLPGRGGSLHRGRSPRRGGPCLPGQRGAANGGIHPQDAGALRSWFDGKNTVLLAGPGLGESAAPVCNALLGKKAPWSAAVLDADALNALAAGKIKGPLPDQTVITPHPGEAARLLDCTVGEVQADREAAARRLAGMYHCIAVLKGRGTLIATPGGEVYHNPTGSAGLAKGGSGDILAGLLSGLLAAGLKQGRTAEDAAIAAVWLHGAAGDRCAKRLGMAAMLPHDIFADLGAIFAELER